MREYYRDVFAQASHDTSQWFGSWRRRGAACLVSLFGLGMLWYLNGAKAALDHLETAILLGLTAIAVPWIAMFSVYLLKAPLEINRQRLKEIAGLKAEVRSRDLSKAAHLRLVDETPDEVDWMGATLTIKNDSGVAAYDVRCEFDAPAEWNLRVGDPKEPSIDPLGSASVRVHSVWQELDPQGHRLLAVTKPGYDKYLETLASSNGVPRCTARIYYHNAHGDWFVSRVDGERPLLQRRLRFTLREIERLPGPPAPQPICVSSGERDWTGPDGQTPAAGKSPA